MKRQQRALKFIETLEGIYPDAECSLESENAFELLCSVQLSAQCTDARVNTVTPLLFEKYPDPEAMSKADLEEIEEIIKPCGFYHNKAKNLIGCAERLVSVYSSCVPDTMDDLLTLPGVGRKTANLILGDVFGKGGMVIDTHAKRILFRMGLTKETEPVKVEYDTSPLIPIDKQSAFCHRMVLFGRDVCSARKAHCDKCQASDYCPKLDPKSV